MLLPARLRRRARPPLDAPACTKGWPPAQAGSGAISAAIPRAMTISCPVLDGVLVGSRRSPAARARRSTGSRSRASRRPRCPGPSHRRATGPGPRPRPRRARRSTFRCVAATRRRRASRTKACPTARGDSTSPQVMLLRPRAPASSGGARSGEPYYRWAPAQGAARSPRTDPRSGARTRRPLGPGSRPLGAPQRPPTRRREIARAEASLSETR